MKKKKILLIVVILLLLLVVGVFLAAHFLGIDPNTITKKDAASPVSLPDHISVLNTNNFDPSPDRSELDALDSLEKQEDTVLFGVSYPARIFINKADPTPEMPITKIVEYYQKKADTEKTTVKDEKLSEMDYFTNGKLLFKGIFEGNIFFVYKAPAQQNADSNTFGALVYVLTDDIPQADTDNLQLDPVSWLYRDGEPALGEVCFFDTEKGISGVAYYDKNGVLLGYRTDDIPSFSALDQPEVTYRFFNKKSEPVQNEQTFRTELLPKVDAEDFLYLEWCKPKQDGQ